ncbi:MAG: HAD hydrolase family protein [Acidobacteriales bacterium]|nr:HAD hydrolase family protein [Terriglobales bacterium]
MCIERARKIKVILFDVDGVLTDGTIWVQPVTDPQNGGALRATEPKGFHAHDGIGFSLAKIAGLKVGVITKRNSETVAIRARDLKLDFCYQGQDNKVAALQAICREAGVSQDEVCYVGDDIVDLPVLRRVGLAVTVPNARAIMKAEAHYVTDCRGGEGAARDTIEYVLRAQGVLDDTLSTYIHEPIRTLVR